VKLGVIVEGQGDVAALPILLRRICERLLLVEAVEIVRPHRISRSKLIRADELERAIELVARDSGPGAPILVVADADDDCPAALGPTLLKRARRTDRAVAVVLAKRELESWFVAAAVSLRGKRGLPHDLEPPTDPEAIRDAKGWLGERMPAHGYSATLDQPAFSALIDLDQAAGARSFERLNREVRRLLLPDAERSPSKLPLT
jgi:hypothetical protein